MATTPDERDERHWGDAGVEIWEIDDQERQALMAQAGPVGEAARQAWQQYLEQRQREEALGRSPTSEEVPEERERLARRGGLPQAVAAEARAGRQAAGIQEATEAAVAEAEEGEADEGEADEGDVEDERAEAERLAAERGLEIRDYGTAGEWRVYDPRTGRMVSRSALEEPAKAKR
jgi:hypothetical protein